MHAAANGIGFYYFCHNTTWQLITLSLFLFLVFAVFTCSSLVVRLEFWAIANYWLTNITGNGGDNLATKNLLLNKTYSLDSWW